MAFIYALVDAAAAWNIRYVGKTTRSLSARLSQHKSSARRESNYRAAWIRKHGDNIGILCLEECDDAAQNDREIVWIAEMKRAGFALTNSATGGAGGGAGRVWTNQQRAAVGSRVSGVARTEETKLKISISKTGKKRRPDEVAAISKSQTGLHTGELNRGAKLNQLDVIKVWKRRRSGESTKQIAASLGVSKSAIERICNGTTWAHLNLAGTKC